MLNIFRKQEQEDQGQIKLGTRVIRGPNWIHKCEDNGQGFLGTIVKFNLFERLIEVIWDSGRSGQYRADPEKYDLRIFDNAPADTSVARFVYIRLTSDSQIKTVIKPNKYKVVEHGGPNNWCHRRQRKYRQVQIQDMNGYVSKDLLSKLDAFTCSEVKSDKTENNCEPCTISKKRKKTDTLSG